MFVSCLGRHYVKEWEGFIFCWWHGFLNGSVGQCTIFHHPVKSQRLLGGLNLVHIFMSPGGWSLRTLVNPCGFSLWKLNYLEAKTYCTWCTMSCFCNLKQSIDEMGGKKKSIGKSCVFQYGDVFHLKTWVMFFTVKIDLLFISLGIVRPAHIVFFFSF